MAGYGDQNRQALLQEDLERAFEEFEAVQDEILAELERDDLQGLFARLEAWRLRLNEVMAVLKELLGELDGAVRRDPSLVGEARRWSDRIGRSMERLSVIYGGMAEARERLGIEMARVKRGSLAMEGYGAGGTGRPFFVNANA